MDGQKKGGPSTQGPSSRLEKEGGSDTWYTWMNLEDMRLSDTRQTQDEHCVIHLREVPGGVRSIVTGSRWWGPGAGVGDGEGMFPGGIGSVWKMGSPEDDGGNACTTTRVYLMPLSCALKNGYGGKIYIIYIFLQF